jgi:DNA-binding transcriptional MerR regulator
MPYKEKEIEKLYFTIGEVAHMFSVNTSHIRFWSKEFDVIRPATNKKGNRLYTQTDIDNFRKIYHLVKEKGFTLKGAKTEMKDSRHRPVSTTSSVTEVLNEIEITNQLQDNPLEIPFATSSYQENLVDKMAIRSSLERIKTSLLKMHDELTVLESK